MTQDEVAMCLGLEEPTIFALKQLHRYSSEEYWQVYGAEIAMQVIRTQKGTGRSTQTLCAALADVSFFRRVHIVGCNQWHTRKLLHEARRYAKKLGFDPELIVSFEHMAEVTHYDHTVTTQHPKRVVH